MLDHDGGSWVDGLLDCSHLRRSGVVAKLKKGLGEVEKQRCRESTCIKIVRPHASVMNFKPNAENLEASQRRVAIAVEAAHHAVQG